MSTVTIPKVRMSFLNSRRKGDRLVRSFCINTRTLRRRLGLSQTVAAERAGISRQAWSNVERGLSPPNLDTVTRMADALGVEPLDLLT
jgi:transcriptional regulator with XRE-family HTH domain